MIERLGKRPAASLLRCNLVTNADKADCVVMGISRNNMGQHLPIREDEI